MSKAIFDCKSSTILLQFVLLSCVACICFVVWSVFMNVVDWIFSAELCFQTISQCCLIFDDGYQFINISSFLFISSAHLFAIHLHSFNANIVLYTNQIAYTHIIMITNATEQCTMHTKNPHMTDIISLDLTICILWSAFRRGHDEYVWYTAIFRAPIDDVMHMMQL